MHRNLISVISLVLMLLPLAGRVAPATSATISPCGHWNTTPPPFVTPLSTDQANHINDGKIEFSQIGDVLPGRPTAIAIAPNRKVYVSVTYSTVYPLAFSSAIYGSIFLLDDTGSHLLIDGLHFPNGLAFIDDDLYVSELGKVTRISDVDGVTCDAVDTVVDNLPFDEVHQTNGLAASDDRLYVSQGYVYEPLESSRLDLRGTIFSIAPDGRDLRVEATGLRNSFGIAVDDEGLLWASDNGPNLNYDPGVKSESDITPDELNLIVPGGDYGFHPQRLATPGATPTARCTNTSCGIAPTAELGLHAAAAGVAWDSRNERVLVSLSSMWQVHAYDPATGTLSLLLWSVSTPTALAMDDKGTLYVAEWTNQRVVKISSDVLAELGA